MRGRQWSVTMIRGWCKQADLRLLAASLIASAGLTVDFDLPGPDYLDIYAMVGVLFAFAWWLRAVTNTDFIRMCGGAVIFMVGCYRLLCWPYVVAYSFANAWNG